MGKDTKIQWTASRNPADDTLLPGHTYNPWRGCQKVSPGCKNCYADAQSARNPAVLGVWGADGTRVVAAESKWREPLAWDREAVRAGVRRRVFCASLCDVFEDWDGDMVDAQGRVLLANAWWPELGRGAGDRLTMSHVRERLDRLIRATPHLIWLLLTKRPENILPMGLDHFFGAHTDGTLATPPNVWLGTSVEDQKSADERIVRLMGVPATVRFLSCEPLLGPVDLTKIEHPLSRPFPEHAATFSCLDLSAEARVARGKTAKGTVHAGKISWVIVGGESGPGARPCQREWLTALVRQCERAKVACFVKQAGSAYSDAENGVAGRSLVIPAEALGLLSRRLVDKKGGDPEELPESLRVRQWPDDPGPAVPLPQEQAV